MTTKTTAPVIHSQRVAWRMTGSTRTGATTLDTFAVPLTVDTAGDLLAAVLGVGPGVVEVVDVVELGTRSL